MTQYDSDDPGDPRRTDGRPRPLNGLGPAALVLPVLSALTIGLYATQRRSAPPPPAPAFAAPQKVELDAWVGHVPLERGAGRLELRLTPLQVDARRQAFDREALADELGLGPGEPWRLEVRYEASTLDRAAATDADADRSQAVRLVDPGIADREGLACAPIDAEGDGPLATLLRTPRPLELTAGESVQLVLWGRRPLGAPRVVGLTDGNDALDGALSLLVVPESDVPASVARRR